VRNPSDPCPAPNPTNGFRYRSTHPTKSPADSPQSHEGAPFFGVVKSSAMPDARSFAAANPVSCIFYANDRQGDHMGCTKFSSVYTARCGLGCCSSSGAQAVPTSSRYPDLMVRWRRNSIPALRCASAAVGPTNTFGLLAEAPLPRNQPFMKTSSEPSWAGRRHGPPTFTCLSPVAAVRLRMRRWKSCSSRPGQTTYNLISPPHNRRILRWSAFSSEQHCKTHFSGYSNRQMGSMRMATGR